MKKVMSILTVAAFFVGAATIVSFNVAEESAATAWYYADEEGQPDFNAPGNPNSSGCIVGNPEPCLIEVDLDNMEPTGNSIKGDRPGH